MSDLKRISGLDVNEDMDYQWREWRVHRIAWVFFIMILVASLLGLFGQGPLSKRTVGDPGLLELEYEYIDRYRAPSQLTFTVAPNVAQDGTVRLALNHDFLERIEVDQFVPEPDSVETGRETVTYVFKISDPALPAKIHMDFEHGRAGTARGEVWLEGARALQFSAFVFP